MGKYIYEGVKDFDLDNIFDCGQCFRWSRQPDGSPLSGRKTRIGTTSATWISAPILTMKTKTYNSLGYKKSGSLG